MRWLIAVLFLVSININAQVIAFDRILSQPVYINDPGPSGISQLVNTLKKDGSNIFTIQSNNAYNTNQHFDDLLHYIFVFTPTIHRAYSKYELQNIHTLVKNGAHIIVVAEHDNYYYNADNLNRICEPYGIKINCNSIKADNTLEGAWPIGKSEKYGLNNIRFYLPASLQCADNVERIATIDTSVVCASVKAEKGRITVLGDYEMLWNMTPSEGINYGDNKDFLRKLFHIEPDKNMYYGQIPDYINSLKNEIDSINPRRFLIAENIINPKEITKNDIVFFIRPTTYLNWPDSIFKRIGKAVIIGSEYSNYFTMLQNEGGQNILDALGYKHEELPINIIAKHFGLRFSESVINSGGLNNIVLQNNPQCCTHLIGEDSNNFYEASSLITQISSTDKSFTTVFKTKGQYRELYYYGPLGFNIDLGPDSIIPMPNSPAVMGAPLCLYNKRVFAVSYNYLWDQLLTPSDNEGIMRKAFTQWLKLK